MRLAPPIVDVLRANGFETDFADACDVASVRFYNAIIVGSAVYGGLWRRDAAALVRDNANTSARPRCVAVLRRHDAGHQAGPAVSTRQRALAEEANAIEHKRFGGRIVLDKLNIGEKVLIKAIKPPIGDFRDFDEIRDWAEQVALELREEAFA